MQNKIKTYIGFAIKSRGFVSGLNEVLKRRSLPIILVDTELAENSRKKLSQKSRDVFGVQNLAELTNGSKVFAITNNELASACKEILTKKILEEI